MTQSRPDPGTADARTEPAHHYEVPPEEMARQRRRAFLGANAGHTIEFYDYGVYGFLASYVGANFFPSGNRTTELLASFAVFALSFLIRPLGGLVFGPLGDRIGRRGTLLTVLTLMAASTFAIGLLPTYAQVGLLAPILLVLVRLLQGLSAGGEVGNVIAFVAEFAGPRRRGYSVSFLMMTATIGFLLGNLVANGLGAALGPEAMTSWGWRVPFLLGGPLGLIALYIRLRLEESPVFHDLEETGEVSRTPLRDAIRQPRVIALSFSLIVMHAAIFYLVTAYLSTHIKDVMKFGATATLWITTGALIYSALLMPIFGHFSDGRDRRGLLRVAAVIAGLAMGLFFLLTPGASLPAYVVLVAIVTTAFGLYSSSVNALMADLIPADIRATVLSFSFNTPIALFGGTAPLIATWMINQTGNASAPALYFMATAAVTFFGLTLITPADYKGVSEHDEVVHLPGESTTSATALG